VIALSVAAALAVFILYTSVAGAGTPQLQPSDLLAGSHHGDVMLVGIVVDRATGDAHAAGGLHFVLKDAKYAKGDPGARVPVRYTGTVPDLFNKGREVVVEGTLHDGTFVATPGSLSTKCPSKYVPAAPKKQT
jgi:cytochrome c-type biogenesis protein CcmE